MSLLKKYLNNQNNFQQNDKAKNKQTAKNKNFQ